MVDHVVLKGLHVGVDARTDSERGMGVSTYRAALIETLRLEGAEVHRLTDDRASTSAMAATVQRWLAAAPPGGRRLQTVSDQPERAWRRRDLFREAQVHFALHGRLLEVRCADPPAIMHWTYPLPLVMRGARNIYTVHDTIPLDHPELTDIDRRRHQRLLNAICRIADGIVTVSEHSRSDLLRHLPDFAGPIVNTYQTVSAAQPLERPLPAGLTKDGYLLACGTVEPRKNTVNLVAAYQASGVSLPLVIVGPDGWPRGRTRPDLSTPGIVRLEWADHPTLLSLVRDARGLLFPSLAEGFGLPALEAMTFGIPTLVSDIGALAEVAAGAALTVDPHDAPALANAIRMLATDGDVRAGLRLAGFARAEFFNRKSYADRLAAVYASLLHATEDYPYTDIQP